MIILLPGAYLRTGPRTEAHDLFDQLAIANRTEYITSMQKVSIEFAATFSCCGSVLIDNVKN